MTSTSDCVLLWTFPQAVGVLAHIVDWPIEGSADAPRLTSLLDRIRRFRLQFHFFVDEIDLTSLRWAVRQVFTEEDDRSLLLQHILTHAMKT